MSIRALEIASDGRIVSLHSRERRSACMVDRAVDAADPAITVTKLSIESDTLWRRAYGYEPVAIDPAYVDSFVVALTEQLVSVGFATARSGDAGREHALDRRIV